MEQQVDPYVAKLEEDFKHLKLENARLKLEIAKLKASCRCILENDIRDKFNSECG
jgi:hypothetical protein